MRQLIVIGTPVSIAIFTESGPSLRRRFRWVVISTTAVAGHQIPLQVATVLFMIPFCIGTAVSVRVGHTLGRNDLPHWASRCYRHAARKRGRGDCYDCGGRHSV
ncbi:MATE family efflux transporter [Bradyrhizobium niftali]|uniref:MATE family efflux transporter n=1 Tax=Bradyrhizobium niftali TaxID=2560055 RepID=UPI00384E2528